MDISEGVSNAYLGVAGSVAIANDLTKEKNTTAGNVTRAVRSQKSPAEPFEPSENLYPPIVISWNSSGTTSGVISFESKGNETWIRKYWLVETRGVGRWTLEDNNLTPSAQLTLTGIMHVGERSSECYMRQSTRNGTICDFETSSAFISVITLTLRSSGQKEKELQICSFKLRYSFGFTYKVFVDDAATFVPLTVVTAPVPQFISYPPNNAKEYSRYTFQPTLIAPSAKTSFNLTLTYLDTEKGYDFLRVYLLVDENGISTFHQVSRNFSGNLVDYPGSQRFLGQTTAAILMFKSDGSGQSTGYGVQLDI